MKVLFYSPYIPKHTGGGEKHFFDVATTVAQKHEVFVGLPGSFFSRENQQNSVKNVREKYESFLNYSLEKVTFVPSTLFSGNIFQKLYETKQYDYLYFVTDGSFIFSAAKQNNLHVQIPFTHTLSFIDKLKLKNWNHINTNSKFTKYFIEKNWNLEVTQVHNPLVSLTEIKPQKNKETIILNVGRFFKQLHSKRQDVLVELFKQLVDSNQELFKSWKLVLIGTSEDDEYLSQIKTMAQGYKIEIKTDISRKKLIEYYQKAAIYWHATGYGVNELQHPEKVEHFGITTIEAMAAGCVPIVINKGGQKEILGRSLDSLLWNTPEDCLKTTTRVIKNPTLFTSYQKKSFAQVKKFSKLEFEKIIWKMFV